MDLAMLATNFEGLFPILHSMLSFPIALLALSLAFVRKTSGLSVGFAIGSVVVWIAGIVLEVRGYGLDTLMRAHPPSFWAVVFAPLAPLVLTAGMLAFKASAARDRVK